MKKPIKSLLLISISMLMISGTMNMLFATNDFRGKEFPISDDLEKTEENDICHSTYLRSQLEMVGLKEDIFNMAYDGFIKLSNNGMLNSDSIISIIDFSKPSNEKRFFVVDIKTAELLHHSVVAHGKNTGEKYARNFSNKMNSHMSSIGFYITRSPYVGGNGYSLHLQGIEKGFNDNAMERAVVIHGADYAEEAVIERQGYLGRSYGCPALPNKLVKQIIEKIKDGNMLFAYYPDEYYLKSSSILN